jgi:hypothetical protein
MKQISDEFLNAFALDLFGFGMYTCPLGAAGAMSFYDPLEGTEIKPSHLLYLVLLSCCSVWQTRISWLYSAGL